MLFMNFFKRSKHRIQHKEEPQKSARRPGLGSNRIHVRGVCNRDTKIKKVVFC